MVDVVDAPHRFHLGKPAALMAAVLLAASCANPAVEQAAAAQRTLVGLPKPALLSCAGVPERQAAVGEFEYFTYTNSRIVSYPTPALGGWYGGPWYPGHRYGWGGWGWPAYGGDDVRSLSCEATFTLKNGVVERIVYGGPGGGTASECYNIVHNCLAR